MIFGKAELCSTVEYTLKSLKDCVVFFLHVLQFEPLVLNIGLVEPGEGTNGGNGTLSLPQFDLTSL